MLPCGELAVSRVLDNLDPQVSHLPLSLAQNKCGSGLAREDGGSGNIDVD